MRGLMMVMVMLLPSAAFADGDPKSLAPPPPAPAVVEANPLPPADSPQPTLPPIAEAVAPLEPVAPVRSEGFGSDVRYWVATQVSGVQSITEQRPLPGEVAKRTYERYLKSFEYPIPETFKRESFTSGGSGGGGSQ